MRENLGKNELNNKRNNRTIFPVVHPRIEIYDFV